MHLRHAPAVALAALALIAAGCGDDDKDSSADSGGAAAAQTQPADQGQAQQQAPQQQQPAQPTTPKPATGGAAAKLKVSGDLSKKPKIPKPTGQAPSKLTVDDVVKGSGAPVKAGDQVAVQYVGVTYADGKQFDASWDRGQDFPFLLGAGMVIPGWDQGIVGMRKGGRRTLVIPSDLAYGPQGSPPAIGPDATLVFVVDLKDASGAAAPGG